MRASKEVRLSLFCTFTEHEMNEKANELSAAVLNFGNKEDAKAAAMRRYKEELDSIDGRVRELALTIQKKGEERMVDCRVSMHEPSVGFKSIIRLDTYAVVKTEEMTQNERQTLLFDESDVMTPEPESPGPELVGDSFPEPDPADAVVEESTANIVEFFEVKPDAPDEICPGCLTEGEPHASFCHLSIQPLPPAQEPEPETDESVNAKLIEKLAPEELAPPEAANAALDEAIDAAIANPPEEAPEPNGKPKVRRPRGFDGPTPGRGVN